MGRLNIVKMAALPQLIHRLNAILIKITAGFFAVIDNLDFKIHVEIQGTQKSQNNLEKVKINSYS